MTTDQKKPINVFLFYAPEDAWLLQEFGKHLDALKNLGVISSWCSQRIGPGTGWAEVIEANLEAASIILPLVSTNFLACNDCYEIATQRAMTRHDKAPMIPIIVRPCSWDESPSPFARLQCLPDDHKSVTRWKDRDAAWTNVTEGILQAINELSLPVASTPPAARPVWNVPYPRNPFFTGREDELKELWETLKTGQAVALSGLAGIGKTQIALEYAYRHQYDYQTVLWVQAGMGDELTSLYLALARELGLLEKELLDSPQVIRAVKTRLRRERGWLLILDGVDAVGLVCRSLPSSHAGHVLLTTSRKATSPALRLPVGNLSIEEGARFLLHRSGLLKGDASLEQTSWQSARALSKKMGGLPLALDQAGAYIEETGRGPGEYLDIFKDCRAELLAKRGDDPPDDHRDSVVATSLLAFERLKSDNPAAIHLLRFCAFMAPEATIPREILTWGAGFLGPELSPVVRDPLQLDKAIAALHRFSLLNRENDVLAVHQVVQMVLRDTMGDELKQEWRKRVVQALVASFPRADTDTKREQLFPHVLKSIERIIKKEMVFAEAKELVLQAGDYLYRRAMYKEVEKWYQDSLQLWEKHLGLEHPEIADLLSRLGSVYSQLGKYREAEPLYQHCLELRKQHLGPEHPKIADPLNNLAILCKVQGKYADAERFYLECLELRTRMLGPEHPHVAQSLNNLGVFYAELGKYEEDERVKQLDLKPYKQKKTLYEEAEQLFQRSLAIRKKTKDPDEAQSLNNLANLYTEQVRYEQAEESYQRCFDLLKEQLGAKHPEIAYCLNGWGLLSMKLGNYDVAERRFKGSLDIWEQGLGSKHPQVAYALNNLGELARVRGDYKEALGYFGRSLKIFNECLGSKHLHTETCAWNYLRVLLYLRQIEEDKHNREQ